MSLFQRPLRPPAILSDQAVERYLEAVRAELSVDPLFRRRLRGNVVNRFVADREARVVAGGPRRMGALGRAVLYATLALSVSVSSAMAASQGAAPGDALYYLKLQIERLRLQALPPHLHDDLAAHSLGERIHELGVLAERGDWARVTVQAAAVEAEYRHFLDTTGTGGGSDRHLVVLSALLERLPDRAQLAIDDVLDGVEAANDATGRPDGNGQGRGSGAVNRGWGAGGAPANGPGATERPESGATPRPTPAARPDPTPRVEPTARPEPTPRLDPSPRATRSPRPSPGSSGPAETEAAGD